MTYFPARHPDIKPHSQLNPISRKGSVMKLQDVFINDFPRASHQPAAFCPFPHLLLVPVNAFFILLFCIVADKKEFVKYKSSVFPSVV